MNGTKKRMLSLLSTVFYYVVLHAQTGIPNNQDCIDAIPVCQTTYNQVNSYAGTGNVPNEINDTLSCLQSGEKNDVWYTFTVQSSGMLNFSIFPKDTNDDYDWALFNLTNNSCSDIFWNANIQTSCNYCSNIGCQGVTGANGQQNGPCGAQDMPEVPVVAGQVYVLNVSNYSASQKGYILDFSQSTAMIYDTTHPVMRSVSAISCLGGDSLHVQFSKNIMCNTVQTTDFSLTGPGGTYAVTSATSPVCAMGVPYSRSYDLLISPAIIAPGTYTLHLVGPVTDICGNVALYPAALSFQIGPIRILHDSVLVHCNNNTADIHIQVSGGNGALTYAWTPNISTGDSVLGVGPGTYAVLISDNNHCFVLDSFHIKPVAPLFLALSPSDSICEGQSVKLQAIVTGGSGVYTYSWSPGIIAQDTVTLSPGSSLTYYLTVTDQNHCKAGPDSTRITVIPAPVAAFDADTLLGCSPLKVHFQAQTTGNPGCAYQWRFGDGGNGSSTAVIHTYTGAGCETVTLTVTAPGGQCSATR
ncbi:MAG TPA: PKD domain-containing protein, partial [Bacteroidia bacterium]|nr:PKD domain-containing protein [Bacteroidia bacterium]